MTTTEAMLLRRAEKAESELDTELLANAALLHQLAEAERERDEARATIERVKALVADRDFTDDELEATLDG